MQRHEASLIEISGEQPKGAPPGRLYKLDMPLYIIEKLVDSVMVLELRGRLTLGSEMEKLREKARQVVEAGYSRIILDLEEANYIDSAGLSTLVVCYTSARKQGGDMKLLHLTKRIEHLLQIPRLSTCFRNLQYLRGGAALLARMTLVGADARAASPAGAKCPSRRQQPAFDKVLVRW